MDKVIPILPCPDIRVQVAFYEALGFTCTSIYTSPNPFAGLEYGTIALNFWGSKRNVPAENPSMVFMLVDDVDAIYETFTTGLKRATGKIPRGGIPRISKVRDLKSDRRFTITDPGGNTLYVGTPVTEDATSPLRTLVNAQHAERFAVLYDLLYSKEDPDTAANLLPRLVAIKHELDDLDRAKLLLVETEIYLQRGETHDDAELNDLLNEAIEGGDWVLLKRRYAALAEAD